MDIGFPLNRTMGAGLAGDLVLTSTPAAVASLTLAPNARYRIQASTIRSQAGGATVTESINVTGSGATGDYQQAWSAAGASVSFGTGVTSAANGTRMHREFTATVETAAAGALVELMMSSSGTTTAVKGCNMIAVRLD